MVKPYIFTLPRKTSPLQKSPKHVCTLYNFCRSPIRPVLYYSSSKTNGIRVIYSNTTQVKAFKRKCGKPKNQETTPTVHTISEMGGRKLLLLGISRFSKIGRRVSYCRARYSLRPNLKLISKQNICLFRRKKKI